MGVPKELINKILSFDTEDASRKECEELFILIKKWDIKDCFNDIEETKNLISQASQEKNMVLLNLLERSFRECEALENYVERCRSDIVNVKEETLETLKRTIEKFKEMYCFR